MTVEHTEITVQKICKNVFKAKCSVTYPLHTEVTMIGKSEAIAKQKLELFLDNKPYSHLDDENNS